MFDLVVCGAGPAGAVAAAKAAAAGRRVLLLERHRLPRHKPCGGGLPAVVDGELAGLVGEAISDCRVAWMRHTWRFEDACLAPLGVVRPLWMVQRPRFDHALVQAAEAAGAELRQGWELRRFSSAPAGLNLELRQRGSGRQETLQAAHLIGADGAGGVVARVAGLRQQPRITLGMEVEVPHRWDGSDPVLRPDVLHLEYGAVHHGYAWVFPKADHLNIGAGVFYDPRRDPRSDPRVQRRIRGAIRAYAERLGVAERLDGLPLHAHPLPVWRGPEPLQSGDGRVLLVGDAAGLINPLFGDGLLHAIRSGRLAAEAVCEGRTGEYTAAVHALLGEEFEAARRLTLLLRHLPRLTYRHGLSDPRLTPLMARLLAGELSFQGLGRRALGRIARGLLRAPGPLRP